MNLDPSKEIHTIWCPQCQKYVNAKSQTHFKEGINSLGASNLREISDITIECSLCGLTLNTITRVNSSAKTEEEKKKLEMKWKHIFRYYDKDNKERDAGPYETWQEAHKAMLKYCSEAEVVVIGPIKVGMDYILNKGRK
jgi:ATP sulfurylase